MSLKKWLKNPFSKQKTDTSAHLNTLNLPTNQLDNTVRLNEQGASKKRIERYWRRWLIWGLVGSVTICPSTSFGIACNRYGTIDTNECLCVSGSPPNNSSFGSWNVASGTAEIMDSQINTNLCASPSDYTCTNPASGATTDFPTFPTSGVIYLTNTTETPPERFKCTFTMNSGFVTTAAPAPPPTPPASNTASIYRVPFAPPILMLLSLLGVGLTFVWRNKNKRD